MVDFNVISTNNVENPPRKLYTITYVCSSISLQRDLAWRPMEMFVCSPMIRFQFRKRVTATLSLLKRHYLGGKTINKHYFAKLRKRLFGTFVYVCIRILRW